MAGSVVRVDPASVDFTDVRVGQVYKTTITARNVGKVSRNIIIEKPRFKVRVIKYLIHCTCPYQQFQNNVGL